MMPPDMRSWRKVAIALGIVTMVVGAVAVVATREQPPQENPAQTKAPKARDARSAQALAKRARQGTLTERAGAQPFRVVVLLIDALRRDRLPFYGNTRTKAPYLSRLAAEGAVFERAYAASSWTSSSVASLFTGLYPNQHHVLTGYQFTKHLQRRGVPLQLNRIPDTAPTLPEVMKGLGLATYGVASNPNIGEPMGFMRGFDAFQKKKKLDAKAIQKQTLRWRKKLDRAKEYFLYLHYMDVHEPYRKHEEWYDEEGKSEALARYDSSLGYLDSKLKELHRTLGWRDDTLIVVLADHGEEFGEHGDYGHHNQLYAELVHIPMLFWWPGVIAPQRVTTPVSHVDVLPTLEALVRGSEPETETSGVSLVPLLDGKALPERTIYAVRASESKTPPIIKTAALRGRWKYIRTSPDGEELYDMESDPRDEKNVVAENRAVADELRRELEAFDAEPKRHARAFRNSERSAGDLEHQLRALGYAQ